LQMRYLMVKLWRDDGGALIAAEYLFVATILILGVIPGLVLMRNAIVFRLARAACALNSLDTCACSGTTPLLTYTDPAPCNISVPPCP
jgi:hypothetical protein